jgi:hypothetical protein
MNIRKITSLTALICFVMLIVTSIILYIVPAGRVAYWSDWRLWTLSKTQWTNLHINLGLLFLLAIALHIYYNWKPIVAYLKNRTKKIVVITGEFNIALVLTIVILVGTYAMVPPFSTVLNLSESIKDAAAVTYGEPPFGHAELAPLAALAQKTGLDPQASLSGLKTAGIRFDSPQAITLDVAKANAITPKALYAIMVAAGSAPSATSATLPDMPPPGSGNKTLVQLTDAYGLDLLTLINGLRQEGLRIDRDQKLKTLAEENNTAPVIFYDLIRKHSSPGPAR